MKQSLLALLIGYVLDLWLGDPHWLPHPVRWIGALISGLEQWIRKKVPQTEKGELWGGAMLAVLVTGSSVLLSGMILWIAGRIHPMLGLAAESWMCYQLLATKSLKTESMKVYEKLKEKNLSGARKAVSMIVGRDTDQLTEEGVAKAAVETVAENTSDGIIAPMCYMALFGAAGGFFYKSVNTMDSMIGYKNEQYLYFGRIAARLDDAVNFIPSRLSAFLLLAAAKLLSLEWKNGWKIYKRDRKNSSSPNAGQTEAVCAGALNVQLLGDAYYFGKIVHKRTMGDSIRPVSYQDIQTVNRMLYVASLLGITIIVLIKSIEIIVGL